MMHTLPRRILLASLVGRNTMYRPRIFLSIMSMLASVLTPNQVLAGPKAADIVAVERAERMFERTSSLTSSLKDWRRLYTITTICGRKIIQAGLSRPGSGQIMYRKNGKWVFLSDEAPGYYLVKNKDMPDGLPTVSVVSPDNPEDYGGYLMMFDYETGEILGEWWGFRNALPDTMHDRMPHPERCKPQR